jgi:sec-independent protein translocase protein TatC
VPGRARLRRLGHDETVELADHLGELRQRLVLCLIAFVPAFAAAFAVHGRIVELLARPLPEGKQLVNLGVTEPFTTSVKVSLMAAVALVLPLLLTQLWSFLAPALTPAAQRAIAGFVVLATALFVAGVTFAYAVVLPRALTFLVGFDDHLYDVQIRASYYYSFAATTLLATGLAFQLPIAILALVRLEVLSSVRLRRNRRIAYVALVVCAVLLPTVDPVSLALEVAPLLALYELSIVLSAVFGRRWATSAEVEPALK